MGIQCSFSGCHNDTSKGSRGLCGTHWMQLKIHGHLRPIRIKTKVHSDWVLEHVNFDRDECLKWPFRTHPKRGIAVIFWNGATHNTANVMCRLAHGEPPTSLHEAAHSCGKAHLGCVNPMHLRWATKKENAADRLLHGTAPLGEKHPMARLTESKVLAIREFAHNVSRDALAELFMVSKHTIIDIVLRRSWRHI